MSELTVGSLSGLAANSYEIDIASGSTLDLANAKASSLPVSAINGSVGGLVPITTQTFSSVSTVSVNDCFTSSYANYLVVLSNLIATAQGQLQMRLRASGTDDSSSNYFWSYNGTRSNNTTFTNGGASVAQWNISSTKTVAYGGGVFQVFTPNQTEVTAFVGNMNAGESSHYNRMNSGGVFTNTTSFDGFSVFPASGNVTGTLRVYGYED